jgi:tetratricopeptide (TPR) repeat protein
MESRSGQDIMNAENKHRGGHKRFPWGFRLALSLLVLLTLALIGVIIWLLKTQDLDKLSTKLGILASIVTALIGLPTLFFTIVKWPGSDSSDEPASALASPGGIQADTITNTTNVVSGMQYIGTQINYGPAVPSSSGRAPADQPRSFDTSSSLWNVPYPRNPLFTGREDLLARLTQVLQPGQATALSQAHAISGLGGIGKTQLAIEYAYQHRQDYRAVLWVRADTRENLVADFVAIAGKLQLPEQDARDVQQAVSAVQAWLHTQSGWLLILDNADDLAIAAEVLPPFYGGQVLLTTRAQAMGRLAQRIEVDTMSQEVGALFLLRRAGLLAPDAQLEQASVQEREQAGELVRKLDELPLALDQAGAYMEEIPCGLAEYLRLYRTQRPALLGRRGGLVQDHPESVAATFSLSFAAVEQANPAAADLLRVCAFLHPDVIPEELLRAGLAKLEPPLQVLGTDELAFHGAVRTLGAYSLLRRDRASQMLSIHRLVQAVLIDILTEDAQLQAWVERSTQLLWAARPETGEVTFPHWEAWERLLPHALTWAEHLQQAQFASLEAGELLRFIGWYLRDRGQYVEAEPHLQQARALSEQQMGKEHQDTAAALVTLGSLYNEQGHYAEAEPLFQRALTIKEQTLPPDHPATAQTLDDYASLLRTMHRASEAIPLEQRARAIRAKLQPS